MFQASIWKGGIVRDSKINLIACFTMRHIHLSDEGRPASSAGRNACSCPFMSVATVIRAGLARFCAAGRSRFAIRLLAEISSAKMSSGTGIFYLPLCSLADIVCIGLTHPNLHRLKNGHLDNRCGPIGFPKRRPRQLGIVGSWNQNNSKDFPALVMTKPTLYPSCDIHRRLR